LAKQDMENFELEQANRALNHDVAMTQHVN